MALHNPFRAKAQRARVIADRLNAPKADPMATSFPLGGGFGRGSMSSRGKKLEAHIARATKAVNAERWAREMERKADAFDRGLINAQGRSINPDTIVRAEKREAAKLSREQRIAAARVAMEGKHPHEVDPVTWATAHGYLGGPARAMIIAEHAALTADHNKTR